MRDGDMERELGDREAGARRNGGPRGGGASRTADGPFDAASGDGAVRAASGVPLFHQIAVILRDRIVSGQLGPGARLPSEADICAVWSVSRITAKRALDALAAEGLVERARGRGTTVLARAASPMTATRLDGWLENISRMAACTTVEVLAFGYQPAPAHIARELDLPTGAEVQRARRVRRFEGRALSHLETWVPAAIGRTYTEAEMGETPLLKLLERSGLRVASARQLIGATVAPPDVAAALGILAGAALLDVRRRVMDETGRPVEFVRALYRPDLYRYEMDLVRVKAADGGRWRTDGAPVNPDMRPAAAPAH